MLKNIYVTFNSLKKVEPPSSQCIKRPYKVYMDVMEILVEIGHYLTLDFFITFALTYCSKPQ